MGKGMHPEKAGKLQPIKVTNLYTIGGWERIEVKR